MIIWLISIIAVIYATYVTWQPIEFDLDKIEDGKGLNKPMIIKKAQFNDFGNGKLNWKMEAEMAKIFHQESVTLLYTIHGKLFNKIDRSLTSRFFSNFGNINRQTHRVTLKGDIQIYFDNGDSLFTEELVLDQTNEVVFNHKRILLHHHGDVIEADAIKLEMKTGNLYFSNPKIQMTTF